MLPTLASAAPDALLLQIFARTQCKGIRNGAYGGGGLWRQHAGDLFISPVSYPDRAARPAAGKVLILQNAGYASWRRAGGDVGMRHAEIANMPMALFIQALHQDHVAPSSS